MTKKLNLQINSNYSQFRSMNAYETIGYIDTENTKLRFTPVKVLKSYNTIVALIINGEVHEFGKYSTTTSKQVTIWERANGCDRVDRVFHNCRIEKEFNLI